MQDVQIQELERHGVGLYSKWTRTATGTVLIVIRRIMGDNSTTCGSLTILDTKSEHASEVHPADWLRWAQKGQILRSS